MKFYLAVQWTRKARVSEFECADLGAAMALWHRVRGLGAFRFRMFYRVGARDGTESTAQA